MQSSYSVCIYSQHVYVYHTTKDDSESRQATTKNEEEKSLSTGSKAMYSYLTKEEIRSGYKYMQYDREKLSLSMKRKLFSPN